MLLRHRIVREPSDSFLAEQEEKAEELFLKEGLEVIQGCTAARHLAAPQ